MLVKACKDDGSCSHLLILGSANECGLVHAVRNSGVLESRVRMRYSWMVVAEEEELVLILEWRTRH